MSFLVLHPGTFSLLVDAGRPGSRSLGVPLGGAADRAAYAIGNALAGNPSQAVALEITFSGPMLAAEHDLSACIFGAPFAAAIDGEPVSPGSVFRLGRGQKLRIGGTPRGARGYLCVHGGFAAPMILKSGTAFAPLAAGNRMECPASAEPTRSLLGADVATLLDESGAADVLRVIDGPQADWFSVPAFFEQSYTVASAANRMGVRLQGEPLPRQPREMVSEAVSPGAVQITNEGLPIILGVDGQTIGGYPKIAHVIRADLDRIGQLRPGQPLRFKRVDLAEAEAIAAERRRRLQRWLVSLRLAAMK